MQDDQRLRDVFVNIFVNNSFNNFISILRLRIYSRIVVYEIVYLKDNS
jgi:hypothetical protein